MSGETTMTALDGPRGFRRLSPALPILALGLVVLGLLFGEEIRAAVGVWMESTAYGHCFFILPIALFLAWERRAAVMGTDVVPWPVVGLAALPAGLVWLMAERLGIMEGQQILLLGFVELLFLAVLGWRMCLVLAVPLLYLGFLVPFGAFATPWLQSFTAQFVTGGLDVLGITNFTDGNTIEIPEGVFFVAEACAGLRFLIASIAFGALYACMIYRSPGKRVVFLLASVVIPIVANGFRGLGIVVLGHILGSAEAAAVDHVLYGWIFFSIVILLLILAGLPFREDDTTVFAPRVAPFPVDPATTLPRGLAAGGLALALTALAPLSAAWLDHRAAAAPVVAAGPGALRGCTPDGTAQAVADGGRVWAFVCDSAVGPATLRMTVAAFPPRVNPGALLRQRRRVTDEIAAEDVQSERLDVGDGANWQLINTTEPDRVLATAAWIDGRPSTGGLAQRRLQAWTSVVGSDHGSVLVAIGTRDVPSAAGLHLSPVSRLHARTAIVMLLQANPGLSAQVEALARGAAQGQ